MANHDRQRQREIQAVEAVAKKKHEAAMEEWRKKVSEKVEWAVL